ncbi:hypothetical protein ACFQ78_34145 [Streptomyces sp. NPDC056519]
MAHARRTGVTGLVTAALLVSTSADLLFTARDTATILLAAAERGRTAGS